MDVLWVALIGAGTALATGLGALPVWALGEAAARYRPALEGAAAGVMAVAAVVGLLLPAADNGSTAEVGARRQPVSCSYSSRGGCCAATSCTWGTCPARAYSA